MTRDYGRGIVTTSDLVELSDHPPVRLFLRVGWFFEGLDDAPGLPSPDPETIRAAAAIGRMNPVVAQEIRGLIDALAAMS